MFFSHAHSHTYMHTEVDGVVPLYTIRHLLAKQDSGQQYCCTCVGQATRRLRGGGLHAGQTNIHLQPTAAVVPVSSTINNVNTTGNMFCFVNEVSRVRVRVTVRVNIRVLLYFVRA